MLDEVEETSSPLILSNMEAGSKINKVSERTLL